MEIMACVQPYVTLSCLSSSCTAAHLYAMQLLMKDVSARLKLSDVADHPWIKANADPAVLSLDAKDKGRESAAAGAVAGAAAGPSL